MLNLTIAINIVATVGLAAAVVVLPESGILALLISYASGILTMTGSRFQVGIESSDPPES
jgi:hypothetical protein|tara:strand:- start:275 stop:454 length:180 start_codon:yes stop_codon:yes gene_type:complete